MISKIAQNFESYKVLICVQLVLTSLLISFYSAQGKWDLTLKPHRTWSFCTDVVSIPILTVQHCSWVAGVLQLAPLLTRLWQYETWCLHSWCFLCHVPVTNTDCELKRVLKIFLLSSCQWKSLSHWQKMSYINILGVKMKKFKVYGIDM